MGKALLLIAVLLMTSCIEKGQYRTLPHGQTDPTSVGILNQITLHKNGELCPGSAETHRYESAHIVVISCEYTCLQHGSTAVYANVKWVQRGKNEAWEWAEINFVALPYACKESQSA